MFTLRKLTLALAITGLLSTPLQAADTSGAPLRILASLPITYGLGQLLVKDSNIALERAAAANLPGSRQSAYFSGRGASALHQLALKLGVPPLLRLGEGELHSGGQRRPSILADALEALIGAVYLDGGHGAADALIRRLFEQVEISPAMSAAAKDAKTRLQEWLQGRKMALPQYEVTQVLGAAHRQTFEVRCTVAQLALQATGQGPSRRAAEQDAAVAMLRLLDTPSP